MKSILNKLFQLFKRRQHEYVGVAEDIRSVSQKARDFQHEEFVAGVVQIKWVEKEWKKYSVRDQNGSFSCVSQSAAKALEISTGIVMSAKPYFLRANFPDRGMWIQNIGDIFRKIGTKTEAELPSQNMNEDEMNKAVGIVNGTKIFGYAFVKMDDIEVIADVIAKHGHCILVFNTSGLEWKRLVPTFLDLPITFGHAVCAVDFALYNGQKSIIVDESWGSQNTTQRVITEDFLKKRCRGAMYFIFNKATSQKPNYLFTRNMYFGLKGNEEVKKLQDCLAFEGLFPTDQSYHTGNYLQATAKAVLDFQRKHGVGAIQEVNALQGKIVGPKTRAKLNKLYRK